ncbi:hypothetical protein O3P69_019318 [Scylla paramamosain]|uniref:Uncharacterized protein n=1 Tax=Scylla paramamosain TaxID=85552 RepID=A0AAW0SZF2_SCYPA
MSPLLALGVNTFDLLIQLARGGRTPSLQPAVTRLTCAFLKEAGQPPSLRLAHRKPPEHKTSSLPWKVHSWLSVVRVPATRVVVLLLREASAVGTHHK